MTEIVKIRTKRGRIITLTVERKTASHFHGTDKFGEHTIVCIDDIDSLLPLRKDK